MKSRSNFSGRRTSRSVPAGQPILRVLLADDHPLVREGIKACLSGEPGIEVVGEAANGTEAMEKVRQLAPDLVLMDLNMPHPNGLEVTALLRRELPRVRVLVFTIHHEPHNVMQVVKAGAHGYLSKDAAPAELVAAIRKVGGGGNYFSSEMAQRFLGAHVGAPGRNGAARMHALSARELEVLKLIADGIGNKQIAARLGVGTRTVETHREHIMRKLDIHTVAGITRFAIAQGLVQLE